MLRGQITVSWRQASIAIGGSNQPVQCGGTSVLLGFRLTLRRVLQASGYTCYCIFKDLLVDLIRGPFTDNVDGDQTMNNRPVGIVFGTDPVVIGVANAHYFCNRGSSDIIGGASGRK